MPRDAKWGLIIGVGLVLTVAVVFFRKDLITRRPAADPAAVVPADSRYHVSPIKGPPAVPRGLFSPARARTASQVDAAGASPGLQEGEMSAQPEGPGPAGENR